MDSAKMEYKGNDVDEAISNACGKLQVDREALDIEIVATGSTGIFGLGKKQAVVRVALRDKRDAGKTATPGKAAGRPPRRTAAPEKREPVGEPVSPEEMELIKKDLCRMLELMGCDSEVRFSLDNDNKVHGHIDGDYIDILTGPEGQTLDGLQYLLRKMVSRKFPQKIALTLDAGNFREERQKELEELAVQLAQEVKETGKTRTVPAINPAERRIVHMALQDDTEIRSRSVGDGLFKKVLIYPPGKGRKRSPRRRRNNDRQKSSR